MYASDALNNAHRRRNKTRAKTRGRPRRQGRNIIMAMEVDYEEYASTSSSKHHGWKVEVSRRHKERREMEALEVRVGRGGRG